MELDREPLYRHPTFRSRRQYGTKRSYVSGFIDILGELSMLPPFATTKYPCELRRGCADAVCSKGGGDRMVAEDILFPVIIKRSLDVQSDNLVEDYNRDSQQGTMGWAAMALRHLFACMRLNGYRYGVLSTVAQTWFVKRTSQGSDDIWVSPAIKGHKKRPSLLQHYLWFIRQASTHGNWTLQQSNA